MSHVFISINSVRQFTKLQISFSCFKSPYTTVRSKSIVPEWESGDFFPLKQVQVLKCPEDEYQSYLVVPYLNGRTDFVNLLICFICSTTVRSVTCGPVFHVTGTSRPFVRSTRDVKQVQWRTVLKVPVPYPLGSVTDSQRLILYLLKSFPIHSSATFRLMVSLPSIWITLWFLIFSRLSLFKKQWDTICSQESRLWSY